MQRSFELLTPTEDPGARQEIKSLYGLLNRSSDNPMRLHLKGSGKLTVCLQFAYEWCEAIEKHETDFEGFIFLNFRNCNSEMSLYRTILDVLAPDSGLNEKDIEDILKSCKRGVVILYGLEKFSDGDPYTESDVVSVVLGDVLPQFHVVVSTMDDTYISDELDSETQTLFIKELDTKFFTEYISKNVSKKKSVISGIITNCTENPYLYKLCKIPQFFTMYAVSSTKDSIPNSATDVLKKVLLPSKKDLKKKKYQERLMEESKLAEKAFELLISKKGGPFFLSVEQLISTVGKDASERYESSGLLVRENTETDKSSSTCTTERFRFCHRIILEWYAAYHFSTVSTEKNDATDTLEKIGLDAFENVIYFTCGIKPDYAEKVIKILQDHGHNRISRELWIMCLLEQEQHGRIIDNVDIMKHLKIKPRIILKEQDTYLYQLSLVRLLVSSTASKFMENGINTLTINECLKTNCHSKNHLCLASGVQIPPIDFAKHLEIKLTSQKLEDFRGILEYAASCKNLEKLHFEQCLLPFDSKGNEVPDMKKKIEVEWSTRRGLKTLEFSTLTWKDKAGGELDEEGYNAIETSFRQHNDEET